MGESQLHSWALVLGGLNWLDWLDDAKAATAWPSSSQDRPAPSIV